MIKAIETKYKGYRFRSRLEARWAVFFDEMGLDWAYEPQGFDLGELGWYLPDFVIAGNGSCSSVIPAAPQESGSRAHFFVEVKGKMPTEIEVRKLSEVCYSFTCYGGLVYGDIPKRWYDLYCFSIHKEGTSFGPSCFVDSQGQEKMGGSVEDFWFWIRDLNKDYIDDDEYFGHVDFALSKSRSARFEHGETPI